MEESQVQKLCRTCLMEANDSTPMSDLFSSANGDDLRSVLLGFCDVQVLKDDGLPSRMCQPCVKLAIVAFHFKNRCKLADAKLRDYLSSDRRCHVLPLRIKIETDDETNKNGEDPRRQNLECVLCHSHYDSSKSLIEHVLRDHSSNAKSDRDIFSCQLCSRKCLHRIDLEMHLDSHKTSSMNKNIHICPHCKEEFLRPNSLLRHIEHHHVEDSFFKCMECNCFFSSNVYLKKHMKKRHHLDENMKMKKIDSSSIKTEPKDAFIKKESAEDDLFESDNIIDNLSDSNSTEYVKNSPENNFNTTVLENDDRESDTVNKLDDHKKKKRLKVVKIKSKAKNGSNNVSSKTIRKLSRSESAYKKKPPSERTFLCSICGKGYYKQNHLDKHLKTHTNEQVKKQIHVCSICGKIVHHSNHLLVHMRTHKDKFGQPMAPQKTDPNKKLILCSMCGKSCSSRSNLAVHMRRHLGVMTCICKICGKGYPRTTDLTLHMRQHTGERPFICPHCNKGFARSDKLAIHMRIHTGEKPYTCQVCGRSFAQSNDLTAHKKRNSCNAYQSNQRSSNATGNSGFVENELAYLSQTTPIVILPNNSSSSKVTNEKNSHQLIDANYKMKKNHQKLVEISSAVSNNSTTNEENNLIRSRALVAAAASNNLLVFSSTTSENVQMLINPESMAARSMSDLMKQNNMKSSSVRSTSFSTRYN